MQNVKLILTDIEGTTSSISFVKDVLFPYAANHLPAFVKENINDEKVQTALQQTAELAAEDGDNLSAKISADNTDALIAKLLQWISEDRKATPLKALQGLIWKTGYENGDYQAHMYPDATEYLKKWHDSGLPLYVYSSGSVKAQELFFGYSQDGNLLPLFKGHFDTLMGGKRETQSYLNILAELQKAHAGLNAADVLFLSDIKEELDAAREAGMQTVWLLREDDIPANAEHNAVKSFAEI
ncbi:MULTISPECIES: acireductone synthase [Thalassolituus]|uniref:acireductone synthase n=1 Tax=Thalassolituus TaxID=187492 RepID=UPI000C39FF5D|nr:MULTISPECIES: acireductone synthase [Thalassolituus]MAX85673.1 acireductone synthase [Oceanospirillaceae bacterium]|tara:strand:- start:98 stop:817 length:720 start_codon:yes stop_codon:yes gene_type:complete